MADLGPAAPAWLVMVPEDAAQDNSVKFNCSTMKYPRFSWLQLTFPMPYICMH